jgi:hypothetical protein
MKKALIALILLLVSLTVAFEDVAVTSILDDKNRTKGGSHT